MRYGLLLLFIASTGFAYDTFFFRVDLNLNPKVSVDTTFSVKGRQSKEQPFNSTNILIQPDTTYVLVQMTPQTDAEFQDTKTMFGMAGTVLWKEFSQDPGQEPVLVQDNSQKYPINTDWTVQIASK